MSGYVPVPERSGLFKSLPNPWVLKVRYHRAANSARGGGNKVLRVLDLERPLKTPQKPVKPMSLLSVSRSSCPRGCQSKLGD